VTTAALVDRLASALPGRFSRRGFLARTAVVGGALATDPLSYVLEPTSAYAAVCNCKGSSCDCGSLCCDGYTEFCCTITGNNTCPAGTVVAGWWKADTAPQFCGGPRYYMDCNAQCGGCGCGANGLCAGSCSGTGCGCANGDCNNRAAGCNAFRYGQCNQGIACLGPIVCRVVTCVPPWAIEPSCTTVTRVDEYTAGHDRPCLHQVTGNLEVVAVEGNNTRVSGWALDYDTQDPVIVQVYLNDVMSVQVSAELWRTDVSAAYPGYGWGHGFDVRVPHPGPAHTLCVVARNSGWNVGDLQLGCRTIPERTTGTPWGTLDEATAGRGAVRVRGWTLDPDRPDPAAVHVYIDGSFAGAGLANGGRPDVGAAYPRAGAAHGFDFTVPAPPGSHQVCVYAINLGGDASPNAVVGCRTVTVPTGAPIGHVDEAFTAPGLLRVRGWTLDPDTPSPTRVDVYVDGAFAATATADRSRPDVGAAYPGAGAAHGFELLVGVGAGVHRVDTYAINRDSADPNSLIDSRSVQTPTGPPFGVLDRVDGVAGGARVQGWAIDPDTVDPIPVHVYVDGRPVRAVPANALRPDVGAAYPLYTATHGFDTTVPMASGSHVVEAYAINAGPGAANAYLGAKVVVVP
jgi:hypothetical protein